MPAQSEMRFRLYHYWRSSSSWRVRWAMAIKGLTPEYIPVSLLDGESEAEPHRKRNPFGFVPALEILGAGEDGSSVFLTESLPIIEFLEEAYPNSPLLPRDAIARAKVRAMAEAVNAGIQPLQNLTTLIALAPDADPDYAAKRKHWAQVVIRDGFTALEKLVQPHAGAFCFGDRISLADLCLVPQAYNAKRFDVDLANYPALARAYQSAISTPGYSVSEPEQFSPTAKES